MLGRLRSKRSYNRKMVIVLHSDPVPPTSSNDREKFEREKERGHPLLLLVPVVRIEFTSGDIKRTILRFEICQKRNPTTSICDLREA